MLEFFKKLFGVVNTDFASLMSEGAIILDVRSQREYASGHIKDSLNIPVNKLPENLNKLQSKNTPIITCCASGLRSESAKGILVSKGYTRVINGGSWHSLEKKLKN